MKTHFLFSFLVLFLSQRAFTQDLLFLINGDTLQGKITKAGTNTVAFIDNFVEKELPTDLISKALFENGKEMELNRPKELGLEHDQNLVVFSNRPGLEEQIQHVFKNCFRKEFNVTVDNKYNEISEALFTTTTKANYERLTMRQKDAISSFRFNAYSSNAFIGLVSLTGVEAKYVFFSNAISGERIKSGIINKTFRLVDSEASSSVLDLLDKSLKPFTMDFSKGEGKCLFSQGGKDTMLEYSVSDDGNITFRDLGRHSGGTTYLVVHLDETTMRYTQFSNYNKNFVTRKVEVITK